MATAIPTNTQQANDFVHNNLELIGKPFNNTLEIVNYFCKLVENLSRKNEALSGKEKKALAMFLMKETLLQLQHKGFLSMELCETARNYVESAEMLSSTIDSLVSIWNEHLPINVDGICGCW